MQSNRIDWTRELHSEVVSRVMRGERVVITDYNGKPALVSGYSRWDEGLSVSQDGRAFMYRAGVYGLKVAS